MMSGVNVLGLEPSPELLSVVGEEFPGSTELVRGSNVLQFPRRLRLVEGLVKAENPHDINVIQPGLTDVEEHVASAISIQAPSYRIIADPENGVIKPGRTDPVGDFIDATEELATRAVFARENQAYSYRPVPFLVASSLYSYNPVLDDVAVTVNGNLKMEKGHSKYCAEMSSLEELNVFNKDLRMLGDSRGVYYGQYLPIGSVTVATSNVDEIYGVTGRRVETLPKCPDCVVVYDDDEAIKPSFVDVTMTADLEKAHVSEFQEVIDRSVANVDDVGLRPVNAELPGIALEGFSNWSSRRSAYEHAKSQLPEQFRTIRNLSKIAVEVMRLGIKDLEPDPSSGSVFANSNARSLPGLVAVG